MKVSRRRQRRRLRWLAAGLVAAAIAVPGAQAMPLDGPGLDGAGAPTAIDTQPDAPANVIRPRGTVVHRVVLRRSGLAFDTRGFARYRTSASTAPTDWADLGTGAGVVLGAGFLLAAAGMMLGSRRRGGALAGA